MKIRHLLLGRKVVTILSDLVSSSNVRRVFFYFFPLAFEYFAIQLCKLMMNSGLYPNSEPPLL